MAAVEHGSLALHMGAGRRNPTGGHRSQASGLALQRFVALLAVFSLNFLTNRPIMSNMNSNIIGLLISFPFLALVIGLGIGLKKWFDISSESMRKFIHIGVSNWWLIELCYFNTLTYALIGPILFIILNSLFTFLDWGTALGLGDRKRNYGLIYFPIALVILVLLQYNGMIGPISATVGVLVMGWGDGLAALIGAKWGKREIRLNVSKKSYLGTATMFLVTLVIIGGAALLYSSLPAGKALLISLILAAVISVVEVVTPLGLDNLSVPLLTTLLIEVLL
ncbi:MAG: hypothetical protein WC233_04055 [Sphaerochaeta sp.]